jgi:hypothetical protein
MRAGTKEACTMQTLDQSATEELATNLGQGGVIFSCGTALNAIKNCDGGMWCQVSGSLHPWCGGLGIPPHLTEGLKACGEGFYAKCPGFERIEKYCEFEPAIEAAKFKEQAQLDKIAQLESRVQELEVALKKRG